MDAAHAVLQQLFYAPLIAVYCAYTWRVENFNHNRNALMTAPVPTGYIFCKAAEHLLGYAADTNMGVGFVCSVRKNRRAARAAGQCYFYWLIRGAWGGMGVATLLLLASMVVRSFAVPVAFGLVGGITGLLASNSKYGMYYPFSLMMMGMNSNQYENALGGEELQFMIFSTLYIVLFSLCGIRWLAVRDVKA